MRARPSTFALGLALYGLLACEKHLPNTARAVTPTPDSVRDSIRVAPPESLTILATPIDTLITLGAWMRDHPNDVLNDLVPEELWGAQICRLASRTFDVDGRQFIRHALFNAPTPPEGEVLPDTTRLAERSCHLQGIWLGTRESDPAQARRVADSLTQVLTARLGASTSSKLPSRIWLGNTGHSWSPHGQTIALAIRPRTVGFAARGESHRYLAAGVVAIAFVANSGLALSARDARLSKDDDEGAPGFTDDEAEAERELELALADSALGWAAISELTEAVRPALRQLRSTKDRRAIRTPAFDSSLVVAARIVHATRDSLEPARRAAVLFAADVLLSSAASFFDRSDRTRSDGRMQAALDEAGAPSDFDVERAWLWSAYRADSLSRAGHAAFVSLLSRRWTTRPTDCEQQEPIEHGEAALSRGDADPLVSYYVGLAYHDSVHVITTSRSHDQGEASTALPPLISLENADSTILRDKRTRAVQHLRTALGGLTDRRMRRHAWQAAVALTLGHTLNTPYFHCYFVGVD